MFSNTLEHYYATTTHELGHHTGHPTRLNRPLTGRFGDEDYAFEELVAEMTSAFCCAHLGLEGNLMQAEYVGAWLKKMKGDTRYVFRAASEARKAAEYLGVSAAGRAAEPELAVAA